MTSQAGCDHAINSFYGIFNFDGAIPTLSIRPYSFTRYLRRGIKSRNGFVVCTERSRHLQPTTPARSSKSVDPRLTETVSSTTPSGDDTRIFGFIIMRNQDSQVLQKPCQNHPCTISRSWKIFWF
ncbi:unnamed protein product, partial [Mesorhabditis spiculigera]